jgi:high-affinity Fe2+/Pb2+ permease
MLHKGGVHDKTNKAKRRKEKQNLRKAWFSLSALCVLREGHAFVFFT